jgi:hypothetical protein
VGYISTMMEASAVVLRPSIAVESGTGARHGIGQDPFVPVDPIKGGKSANQVPTALPCSVQQAGPREMMLYGQRNAEFNTLLIFAQDPKCQMNDRMDVTDRTLTTSSYLVIGAARPIGRARQWLVAANFIEQPLYP